MAATSPIAGDSSAVIQTIKARAGIHRGDLWRAIVLGLLCFLMIAPLIMAIFIPFKSPSQFARVPFVPTLPLQWANYQFAAQIVSQFLLNSIFVSGLTTQYYTSYGRVMAGLLLGALPLVILFFFTSKLFVEGLTSGAIKRFRIGLGKLPCISYRKQFAGRVHPVGVG